MPSSYDTSSRHFDDMIRRYCPHTREQTLAAMDQSITRRRHDYEQWRIKREAIARHVAQPPAEVPAVQHGKARRRTARR